MHRLAMYVLGAGLLISQGSVGATLVPDKSNATVASPRIESGDRLQHPSRTLSLAEEGYTDRLIIVWKGETARRAAAAVQANAMPVNGKPAAQASAAARADAADPDRPKRLDRVRILATQAGQRLRRDLNPTPHRRMADGAEVLKLPSRVSPAVIAELKQQLLADPEMANRIADVLPDRLFFPQLTPNDPQYANQWALSGPSGINAPAAWDSTTGNPNLVIGVIDTGKLEHADLNGRWIGGYDFVSLAERSNDGDLRDSDATDPGDWVTAAESLSGPLAGCPVTNSRWHGTAMAGIIAATGNNAQGIAGINWNSKILPVRVVGKCGGYESDIADGMRWAVGLSVPGVPANPNPASVLNMSLAALGLGAGQTCSSILQSAIDAALTARVPIVVAAGNNSNSTQASTYSPGNCIGVITVGATDKFGGLPSYANTGPPIALAAPGGAGTTPTTGVVTTGDSGTTTPANDNAFIVTQGTSAAAAQVSGIVSLVLSVNPRLKPSEVRDILVNTSTAFPLNAGTNGSTNNCSTAVCGAGIAASLFATQAAQRWGTATPMVVGGAEHGLALRSDGAVFAWGRGYQGQLGIGGAADPQLRAVQVDLNGAIRVAAGDGHSLALRADGTVWAWGSNSSGQLGDGTTTTKYVPVFVPGLTGVIEIAAGGAHSLALKNDGTIWAWGYNGNGQLGDGTQFSHLSPTPVPGLANATLIAAGSSHSLSRTADGSVRAWGANSRGQLGDGSTINRLTPVQVANLTSVAAIRAGGSHSLAQRSDNTVWAWGDNALGQLGNASTTSASTPVQTLNLTAVSTIGAGYKHSLARKGDGTVWAWGANYSGQLGDGTITTNSAPVPVAGLTDGVSVAGGGRDFLGPEGFSFAVNSNGTIAAWGVNTYGQLADGTSQGRLNFTYVLAPSGTAALNLLVSSSSFATTRVAQLGSLQVSNAMYVTAIANGSAITVSGGEYSIDDGAFTATPGTINPGQTVTLRQTASASCNTTTMATLTIAGVSSSFSVTTIACDAAPDPFAFVLQSGVPLSSVHVSNSVAVTGISGSVPISVAGGEYSIGCTAFFTTAAGTITNGQTVCVRQTASAGFDTLTNTTLTIGTFSTTFPVITLTAPGFSVAPMVAAGAQHGLGLRSDGVLFAWGSNIFGVLGIGASDYASRPVPAPTLLTGVVKIAAGDYHNLALRADGTVWSWGLNDKGQLGNGRTIDSPSPVQVNGLTGVSEIAGGRFHSLARRNDGTVWAWGFNDKGQLGDASLTNRSTPVQIPGLPAVTLIAAGFAHSLALMGDGAVWAWGDNQNGSLGDGSTSDRNFPVQVSALGNVASIAAGSGHSIALKNDNTVWTWGRNDFGQTGIGSTGTQLTPIQATALAGSVEVAAGAAHSLARKNDGSIWAWGYNGNGELGDSTTTHRLSPRQISGAGNSLAVRGGGNFSYAFNADGTVAAWGANDSGQLGVGGGVSRPSAVLVQPPALVYDDALHLIGVGTRPAFYVFSNVFGAVPNGLHLTSPISVAGLGAGSMSPVVIAGGEYSINGGAFTAVPGTVVNGDNLVVRGQSSASYSTTTSATLTIGGASGRSATFYIRTRPNPGSSAVIPQTRLGDSHSYVLNAKGTAFGFGYNGNGQLGNGTTLGTSLPTPVAGLGGLRDIASGANHGLALRDDRTVVAWGYNAAGQLGSGSTENSIKNFVAVSGLSNIVAIAAGDYHSLTLKQDGTVWAWGLNVDGQLGDGSTVTLRNVPVQVTGLSGVVAIAAGGRHSLAVKIDGSVVAWGSNSNGQLGNGSIISSNVPIAVLGLSNIATVAAGGLHSLAVKDDATVAAWGSNAFGQLGVGDTTNRLMPVLVPGLTQIGRIAAGAAHSLALKAGGTFYSWGNNANNQLGDASTTNKSSPYLVPGITNVVAIGGGGRHSAAVRADGKVSLFGDNFFGQLGNKSGNYSPHSSALNVLRGDSQISGFGGSATSSAGSTSSSGSAIIDIAGLATDYDFGDRLQGSPATIDGSFKNQALIDSINGVGINVINTSGSGYSLQSNTCGSSLPAGRECNFTVAFNPNSSGDQTGRLEVASSLIGSPEIRQLFGKGIAPATPGLRLTTTSNLNYFLFEPQTVGTTSSTKSITIANTGNALLSVFSVAVTTGQNDFAITSPSACASVAAGSTCTLGLQFNPIAPNSPNIRSGLVTIMTNAGTQTVTVEGAAAPSDAVVSGLMLIGAVSRKNHGTAALPNLRGVFIDRTKTVTQAVTVEPRTIGAGHQIVFQFNGPIATIGAVTLTDRNDQLISGVTVTTERTGNDVVVTLANVADATRLTIDLANVNGTTNARLAIGFLVGDINSTGMVTAADIAGVKARNGKPADNDNENFRSDLNTSGVIDAQDSLMVKARAGGKLP